MGSSPPIATVLWMGRRGKNAEGRDTSEPMSQETCLRYNLLLSVERKDRAMKKLLRVLGVAVLLQYMGGSAVSAEEAEVTQENQQGVSPQPATASPSPSSQSQSVQTFTAPEVIVTATKTKELTTHTTVATDVITWEEIQERQQTDVLQILRDV